MDSINFSNCNACGSELAGTNPAACFTINRGGRGVRAPWFWCRECGSCFCGIDSSETDSIVHHQTREHGRLAKFEHCKQLKQQLYEYICAGLSRRGLAGCHVLDVGASFGGFVEVARRQGFEVSAVDLNPDCIEHLRNQGLNAIQASSLKMITPEQRSFDAISMLDVTYYFKNQRGEFETARALLRPGGWLVVRTTNKRWLIYLSIFAASISMKWGQRLFARAVVDHSFVQSLASLSAILRDCGYRQIRIEADETHLVPGADWKAKSVYRLGMLISKVAHRPLLIPGVIVWAQR